MYFVYLANFVIFLLLNDHLTLKIFLNYKKKKKKNL